MRGFTQIGGIELLAGHAQGDVAVLHQRGQDDEQEFRLKLIAGLPLHVVLDGHEFLAVDDLAGRLAFQLFQHDLGVAGLVRLQLVAVQQFQTVENGGRQIILHATGQPADHVFCRLLEVAGGELHRECRVLRVTILEGSRQADRAGQFQQVTHGGVAGAMAFQPLHHLLRDALVDDIERGQHVGPQPRHKRLEESVRLVLVDLLRAGAGRRRHFTSASVEAQSVLELLVHGGSA